MKPYHKNPRKISDKQLNDLRRWLDELGDLSGIVHDLNSDEIIGGNQRTAVLGFSENDITITERLPEPDRQGTIAHGYILWHGARYAYRQVAWTPEQCERANIIANKAGGDWEIDRLLGEFETAVLLDSGFGQDELDDMLAELEKGEPPAVAWDEAFNGLPTEDRSPFQQMTFTLHDFQAEQVKIALGISRQQGGFVNTGNENGNGNALARICETYITNYGSR